MPNSDMRVMIENEAATTDPQNFYFKFCIGLNRIFLDGREPTKAEVIAKLKEEAAHHKEDLFLSAFLACAADHIDIEQDTGNKADDKIAAPYFPSYNECTSKFDINWM